MVLLTRLSMSIISSLVKFDEIESYKRELISFYSQFIVYFWMKNSQLHFVSALPLPDNKLLFASLVFYELTSSIYFLNLNIL